MAYTSVPLVQKEKVMTPSPVTAPDLSFQTNFTSKVERVLLGLKEKGGPFIHFT
jgi:hypothetical protein